jgi:hypothetical protein
MSLTELVALVVSRAGSGLKCVSEFVLGRWSDNVTPGAGGANLGLNISLTTEWLVGAGVEDSLAFVRVPSSLKHNEHLQRCLLQLVFGTVQLSWCLTDQCQGRVEAFGSYHGMIRSIPSTERSDCNSWH